MLANNDGNVRSDLFFGIFVHPSTGLSGWIFHEQGNSQYSKKVGSWKMIVDIMEYLCASVMPTG